MPALRKKFKSPVGLSDHTLGIATPIAAKDFGLSLYHCLSQVQDAFNEIERYTLGYVDNYLHDGGEMLREAKQRRNRLKKERLRLKSP